jgi:hypothetical protein
MVIICSGSQTHFHYFLPPLSLFLLASKHSKRQTKPPLKMKPFAIATAITSLVSIFAHTSALLFAQREAPEMVVYYVNEQAAPTACTNSELAYIDRKMLADIDMTLFAYNYLTPVWEISSDAMRRDLAVRTPNCDFCRSLYPRNLCNQMYNCKFRRQLRKADHAEERRLTDYTPLVSDVHDDCQDNLAALSYSWWLSRSCRAAIRVATCHVEIL